MKKKVLFKITKSNYDGFLETHGFPALAYARSFLHGENQAFPPTPFSPTKI